MADDRRDDDTGIFSKQADSDKSAEDGGTDSKDKAGRGSILSSSWFRVIIVVLGAWLIYYMWMSTSRAYKNTILAQRKEIESLKKDVSDRDKKIAELSATLKECRLRSRFLAKRSLLKGKLAAARSRCISLIDRLRDASAGSTAGFEHDLTALREELFGVESALEWEIEHCDKGAKLFVYSVIRKRLKAVLGSLASPAQGKDTNALKSILEKTREVIVTMDRGLPVIED